MKITRRQLERLVKEELTRIIVDDVHEVPDDLGDLDPHEAYGLGHETGKEHAWEEKPGITGAPLVREAASGHEDNQTRMVRRYLIQIGRDEEFASMSEKDIDRLAADLRLMSPSEKKTRDLYDLSVPTDIWQRNRNLGQTPDGSNLQRIRQMLANRPDSYEEDEDDYEDYEEYEDIDELASHAALVDLGLIQGELGKDEMLYRDNPDYKAAYDKMVANPVPDAPSPPKYNTSLRKALFGSEYPDDGETGPGAPYDY